MAPPPAAPWSSALADAVRGSDPVAAMRAGLAAADAKVPPLEIARAVATSYAGSVDVSPAFPPHGIIALSAAVRLSRHLPPRLQPLPVLQALTLAAEDGKIPYEPLRRRTRVSGEIGHLTRSFEYAVRTGGFEDAAALFSGLLREGRERVMAGDALFRLAAEDMENGGHKLIFAVQAWRLASALGWRDGDALMAPAVARVATGAREPGPWRAIAAALGRERLGLAEAGRNAGPAEGEEAERIRSALRAPSAEACARGLVLALKRGVAPDALAAVVVDEAAARLASVEQYDFPAIHGVIYADLARWVLGFSRTETRVVPVLQAGLLLQGAPHVTAAPRLVRGEDAAALLRDAAAAMEAGSAAVARECVATYVGKGYPVPLLLELLVHQACRDGPTASRGHNLILADAAVEEATAHRPGRTEPLVALSGILALSPRDRKAWAVLGKRFPLGPISS